jgi:D-arabinose 1-dehydrogenase-like Zn-dependent alcohol dehydrogenase
VRAMAVTDYGSPLEPIDLPDPQPAPGQALLKVLTCGVCFTDVKTSRGRMPFSSELALPHVPGHEVFGEVMATNPPGLLPTGTRAIVYQYWPCGRCPACLRGTDQLCTNLTGWMGFVHPGGFRERIAVPVERLIAVPATIDAVHAAPMSCAIGTAYRSVVTRGGVGPGDRVAVLGLGGVGIHAAQVARASGGQVTGFDVRASALAAARELDLDAREAAEDGTVDAGEADVVIDTVGIDGSIALAQRLVRRGGRIVAVGYSPAAFSIPSTRLVLEEIEVVGSRYASRDEMARSVALVAAGLVRPVVRLIRPLEAVNEVLERLESGRVVGRAVLDVAGVA